MADWEEEMKPTTRTQSEALLIAGEMAGMASRLDDNALEEFLKTAPPDFVHTAACKAVIAYKRAIYQRPQKKVGSP